MPIRSQRLSRGVSMLDDENSWASQVLASATTNIKDMARFQQRQLLEKEQKLMQLYDQQQLRAHQVAQRGSAGSNGSNSSGNGTGTTVSHHQTVTRTTTSTHSTANSQAGGKVRQMFDERRQTTVKGIDKSYPLEPLDNRSRKQQSNITSTLPLKNGNPMSNRQSLVMRKTVRTEANSNINGGKPIVSYHEEVTRESCGPTERDDDQEEFGDDNIEDPRYANGNRNVEQRSEVHIEDVTNENVTQRHRTTAKIHLSEFDSSIEANRFGDNLENEQFPEELVMDAPERLPRRAPAPKKLSQAEARLERFKNSNTKRPGQTTKHVAGNTTSFTKKRTETSIHSGSTSRASTTTRTAEDDTSTRARSTTPEVEQTGRPGSSTPEERPRKLTSPVVDRTSIVARSSGVSKVSQLTHKNSMDFYPRRKSEFEKSRTFRKLQLELGESSPEPAEPDEQSATGYTKQCRKRSSILDENIYSPGRRSLSSSPSNDRDAPKGRRVSREKSPDYSPPRRESESPVCERNSSETKEETRTSSVQSHTYSSRRRSSSSSLVTDRETFRERRASREMSPDGPRSRKESESPIYERKSTTRNEETRTASGGRQTTSMESNLYSTRRKSSSTRPTTDGPSTGRRVSREKFPEHPQTRKGTESPVYDRKSVTRNEEIRTTRGGTKTAEQESSIYSSRRRSSSSSPTATQDAQKGRRRSREISPEIQRSRKGSESPIYERKSTRNEDIKITSTGINSAEQESNIYASRRRSSSSSPTAPQDSPKGRRNSREMSPENPRSRKSSASPIDERKSTIRTKEIRTTGGGRHSTSVESNFYSSRRRSSSSRPTIDSSPYKGRRVSREKSPERPRTRKGPGSPVYGRKTAIKEEIRTTSAGIKSIGQESTIYSSRRRSSSSSPTPTDDFQQKQRYSREMSPERPQSRRGSESPVFRRASNVSSEETKTTRTGNKTTSTERRVTNEGSTGRSESPTCVRMTRKRSESPRSDFGRPSIEREESKGTISRRTSDGTLRSVELVKNLARPGSPERKTTTSTRQSLERKTTLEDVELRRPESRQRSKSPQHRVVKKDKTVMEIARVDRSKIKDSERKTFNETRERTARSRSRTASPSPPRSTTMKETASFRAKKAERKNSSETKRIESKHHQHEERKVTENTRTNLSHEKARNCDLINVVRSPSPVADENDQSRRSSAEITVRRHETFKVSKPSQRVIEIECQGSVDKDQKSTIGKPIKEDAKDKSQLLEQIERIRTTLSKTGRSEQNLQELKDFERTDSVESALRRFDSIGVETEHHVTVGVDEIDRSSSSPSPESVHRSMKETVIRKESDAKKSVDSRIKPTKINVAVVKTQPKGADTKTRDLSKEKNSRVNLRQKISETMKSVKAKKQQSTTPTTPRQSVKPRASQKIMTTLVRKSRLRGEESSGRGEGRTGDRSPECKRRLFDDPESEIETDNSKSTVVLSTITRVTKSPGLVEIETRNNRNNLKIGSDNIIRSESSLRERSCEREQPTKVLRSIEDIRKSIKRESQDFKRELNKFNTAMRRDEEMSSSVSPDATVTSGIISCVKITKTLKPGDIKPVVKIERSTVKLPITHRVTKSPSPDIGVKRSIEGRARTPTASVRRSVPSSPAKSPDAAARYGSAESKSPGPRPLTRTSQSPSATREDRVRSEVSRTTTDYSDCTDGPANHSELTITESVSTTITKRNDEFVIDELDDDEFSLSKESASSSQGKPPLRKQSTEKLLTSQKQQKSPSSTPLPRPASALSSSSTGSARGQASQIASKSRMSTKAKSQSANVPKGAAGSARGSTASAANDGLAPCKICGRRFNSDRITLHEQICSKTATKKRKQFDATIHRVRGTELEQFVVKKGGAKKGQTDRKTSKPEVKSNWRRKHEDFINAIRSAKQVQAHLAAGGKLSDLPPPPASDTSDYIQCPHCGRKFNQAAAERHIPKCQNMLHNKPNPRAPPKPKR